MKFKVEDILNTYEEIKDTIYEQSRWTTYYERIFKVENKFYSWCRGEGSTENQENDYSYNEEVECIEVEPYEVTVIEFREVK